MRTLLTVLGVVIGTASIVVMLSLGIGLKQAMLEQVGTAGGLTEIMVEGDESTGLSDKLLSDDTIKTFMEIPHVEGVEPQIQYYTNVQTGRYECDYLNIIGVSPEYLAKIELGEGELPETGGGTLNMIAGNQVVQDFFDYTTGSYPYYESEDGELPDIDLLTSPMIAGIDEEKYEPPDSSMDTQTQSTSPEYMDSTFKTTTKSEWDDDTDDEDGDGNNDFSNEEDFSTDDFGDFEDENISYSSFTSSTKRVPVKITGLTQGDEDSYTEYSWNCYTDIELLKAFLKQNYSENSIIPGQPVDRDGKPYRDLKYTMLTVNVDESSNVEEVLQTIQDMGYRGTANKEWLEEIEKEFMIIEAVLGGIGAVAMLVAAISIANTMTMSTYERTKEIGIMKVLGCSLGNIRSMFLAEAAFIGFLGGIVGILLSYSLSFLANRVVAPMAMSEYGTGTKISLIPLWLVLVAIVFSTIIGMLAGFFPAQRATKLSPLAAIRNE
ncbi:MAG: ABC transporter permease [Bacteroidales bacterium]|nr:ABC transporter permease [Clostridium sp.]MCM1204641.1 ABC transporter permease [Bacteroidales bacterium]